MALTYQAISSQVLTGTASSVTLSSIPGTYTDLIIRMSVRTNYASVTDILAIQVNGDTTANYSTVTLISDGSTASSSKQMNSGYGQSGRTNSAGSTASVFGAAEIYIPNYTLTSSRQFSTFGVSETNAATGVYVTSVANLYRGTSAISSITLYPLNGTALVAGSRFDLYGLLHA